MIDHDGADLTDRFLWSVVETAALYPLRLTGACFEAMAAVLASTARGHGDAVDPCQLAVPHAFDECRHPSLFA